MHLNPPKAAFIWATSKKLSGGRWSLGIEVTAKSHVAPARSVPKLPPTAALRSPMWPSPPAAQSGPPRSRRKTQVPWCWRTGWMGCTTASLMARFLSMLIFTPFGSSSQSSSVTPGHSMRIMRLCCFFWLASVHRRRLPISVPNASQRRVVVVAVVGSA